MRDNEYPRARIDRPKMGKRELTRLPQERKSIMAKQIKQCITCKYYQVVRHDWDTNKPGGGLCTMPGTDQEKWARIDDPHVNSCPMWTSKMSGELGRLNNEIKDIAKPIPGSKNPEHDEPQGERVRLEVGHVVFPRLTNHYKVIAITNDYVIGVDKAGREKIMPKNEYQFELVPE